jgi:glycosyltransferase involved in cell wall biosynthesis
LNLLFVHQHFPGQYIHLVQHLIRHGHRIVFIAEPSSFKIPQIQKVHYAAPSPKVLHDPKLGEIDLAFQRANAVHAAALRLQNLGFVPDIIIGHHGWGELLRLPELFPETPMLGYLEFYYQFDKADAGFDPEFGRPSALTIHAKNTINNIALALGKTSQTPTEWQRSTYPTWAQRQIQLVREGVDLGRCRPNPGAKMRTLKIGDLVIEPEDKLVTYVARNLEPYRGFHTVMRALPSVLAERPDVKVVLVGGDKVSYGFMPTEYACWRLAMLAEVRVDPDRVSFPGTILYDDYLALLQRSDAHIYLTYPFVASWSLREALAIGCAIIGSDTVPVSEFITHGVNGLLTPCLDPCDLADAVLKVLEDADLSTKIRNQAHRFACDYLNIETTMKRYDEVIEEAIGKKVEIR